MGAERYSLFKANLKTKVASQIEANIKIDNESAIQYQMNDLVQVYDYPFLLANASKFETQVSNFMDAFANGKINPANAVEFGCCYAFCKMLVIFYKGDEKLSRKGYSSEHNARRYEAYCDKLTSLFLEFEAEQKRIKTGYPGVPEEGHVIKQAFWKDLRDDLVRDLEEIFYTLTVSEKRKKAKAEVISHLRSFLGTTNIYRLALAFSRVFLRETALFVNAVKGIDVFSQIPGVNADIDGVVANINAVTPIFNYLSVGIFASRFALNFALLIRHVCFPTEDEAQAKWTERLKFEFKKRHYHLINDSVWMVVNALTNFNSLFKISGSVAGYLTAGFLLFDFCFLIIENEYQLREYNARMAEYNEEILALRAQRSLKYNKAEQEEIDRSIAMLEKQKTRLTIEWKGKEASLTMSKWAAALLCAGFSSTIIFGMIGIATTAPLSLSFCVLAVALYLSAQSYGNYKAKTLLHEQLKKEPEASLEEIAKAAKDEKSARNDFIFEMVKNVTVPLFVVTVFAVCWQAALAAAILYLVGSYVWNSYKQHNPPEPALPALAV